MKTKKSRQLSLLVEKKIKIRWVFACTFKRKKSIGFI